MSYNPNNPNGQATMANSAPVVIASDQSALPISGTVTATVSGVATAANQTNGTQTTQINGGGNTATVTASSALKVDGSAVTQPISAASLPLPTGASTAANQAAVIGSAGGGAAATNSLLSGSQYNSSAPTLVDGQQVALQSDTSGNLKVNIAAGAVSNTANGNTGSAVPTQATQVGGSDGTNLRAVSVDTTGKVNVNNISGTVSLPTGASTSALQSSVQGSASGGTAATSSQLDGGIYNTTLPTLTNGQQAALQLTAAGQLITSDSQTSLFVGPTAPGTAASNSAMIGGEYRSGGVALTNGQQAAVSLDVLGNLEIVAPDITVTGAATQTATVNNILTAASGSAATNVVNYKSAAVQVISTGTGGTFIFEGSNDNVNFQTLPVFNQALATGAAITAAITAAASQIVYVFPLQVNYIRLRIATNITGGSIQAFARFTQATWAPNIFPVAQSTAANLNTTATIASGTVTTVTTVAAMTKGNVGLPVNVNDVASAPINSTTTTAAFTPTFGSSYMVDIPVTAVSGTTPTLQVTVQESPDGGNNWYSVYAFPTITAMGSYTSPVITMTGTQVRYVQTVGGTTPSFTRAISRVQSSQSGYKVPTGGVLTDASGTTSGTPNTSTQIMAANSFRKYLLIQNVSSNTIWINFTSAATTTQPSVELLPGGSLVQESGFVSGEAINVISSVASQAYTAKWA